MPMERAEPARVRMAASTLAAFMSLSLVLAISSSLARVVLPTLLLWGGDEPFSSLTAFLIRTVAGGVLMMKVKLLSAEAGMTTGSGRPGSTPWVWALNALQNSMMFRPRWPSAGPIGGDGLALPAGTCSLMTPPIFFAMSCFPCGYERPGLPTETPRGCSSGGYVLRRAGKRRNNEPCQVFSTCEN